MHLTKSKLVHLSFKWNSTSLCNTNIASRGQLWKSHQKNILWPNQCHLIGFLLFEPLCNVQKYIFCSVKPRFCFKILCSGIINCNTFSVVPSLINENAKNVMFHYLVNLTLIGVEFFVCCKNCKISFHSVEMSCFW